MRSSEADNKTRLTKMKSCDELEYSFIDPSLGFH